jgi:hypothetical protein
MATIEYSLVRIWVDRPRQVLLDEEWVPLNFMPGKTFDEGWLFYLVPRRKVDD